MHKFITFNVSYELSLFKERDGEIQIKEKQAKNMNSKLTAKAYKYPPKGEDKNKIYIFKVCMHHMVD